MLYPVHNAVLALADGTLFYGYGLGVRDVTTGEICFHTALTGYQETLTDPSFAGQIITFTFPHIGIIGTNDEDMERDMPHARGLIIREAITEPSSFRSHQSLQVWLERYALTGICGIDTRALTRHIRNHGAQNCAIAYANSLGEIDTDLLVSHAKSCPDMAGLDLSQGVTVDASREWTQGLWECGTGYAQAGAGSKHIVAIDYGMKDNILRHLAARDCRVTVVPASATAEEILTLKPDGVFLSNGPGDPSATSKHTTPVLKALMEADLPIFGICFGHQLLALALGAKTEKMVRGHRGANQPVQDLETGKVEITSQNHGFVVTDDDLPAGVSITHRSLFDGTVEGLKVDGKPIFSVQYHPEASPGPHDSGHLFDRFMESVSGRWPVVGGR